MLGTILLFVDELSHRDTVKVPHVRTMIGARPQLGGLHDCFHPAVANGSILALGNEESYGKASIGK